MDIIKVYKRENNFCYYVQKLSSGQWKAVAWSYDLNAAWQCARERFSVEKVKYRVIRVDVSTLINYE